VSTLVTLYLNVDNFKAASDLFNDTLSWYSQKEVTFYSYLLFKIQHNFSKWIIKIKKLKY